MKTAGEAATLNILIASPLEDEHVQRIRRCAPDCFKVLHHPELLSVPRYVADHTGTPRNLTKAQRAHWAELLSIADILFDFDRANAANLAAAAPRLRWVQATSAGIGEFLQRTGLDRSDIVFTTAAGVHARPLAEFTLLALLYFFRDLPQLQKMKMARHWERYTAEGLEGNRLLVIGLGAVGCEIARQCASFGMDVWGLRRRSSSERPEGVSRCLEVSELRAALSEVDALALACPLTAETRLLIGRAEIEALKPGSVLVNVARGGVVDEDAMIRALSSGQIKGAALDVFAIEPLPPTSPIWDLPNVIFSPHSASTVAAENGRIVDLFLDNLKRFADGRPLRNLYERERGY